MKKEGREREKRNKWDKGKRDEKGRKEGGGMEKGKKRRESGFYDSIRMVFSFVTRVRVVGMEEANACPRACVDLNAGLCNSACVRVKVSVSTI